MDLFSVSHTHHTHTLTHPDARGDPLNYQYHSLMAEESFFTYSPAITLTPWLTKIFLTPINFPGDHTAKPFRSSQSSSDVRGVLVGCVGGGRGRQALQCRGVAAANNIFNLAHAFTATINVLQILRAEF